MFFSKTGSIKWTQRKRNEFDEANRNDTEDDINKLVLEAEKKITLQLYLQKQQGHPRERERESERHTAKRKERGGGRKGGWEGNKDGIKFNLHSFTQTAPAERGDELVFEEEAGQIGRKQENNRRKFRGESHSVTALFYVEIIFT